MDQKRKWLDRICSALLVGVFGCWVVVVFVGVPLVATWAIYYRPETSATEWAGIFAPWGTVGASLLLWAVSWPRR